MTQIKTVDWDILRLLRKDARVSLVQMKKVSGIATSTSYDRMNCIYDKGLITSYASILSENYLSSLCRVLILVSCDTDISSLAAYSNTVYKIHSLYVIEAYFPNKKHLTSFKNRFSDCKILKIKGIEKKEGFLF